MGHHHHHHHHHEGNAEKNIAIVFILNVFFVVVEIVGGIITNSIAILSDAVHDVGDCLSLAVSWIMQKKSSKSRDSKYSYGYKRFSLLGSIFLSGVLTVSSIWVIVKASMRLLHPEEVNAQGMLWLAVFGIIINGAAALRVKGGHSLNERSVYIHIMEDVLGWVAVLVASVVMFFWNIPIIDPILSIAISLWVLINVFKNIRAVFKVLLQAIPEDVDIDVLNKEIKNIQGVISTHDLHIWSMDGESHIMTLHIVTDSDADIQFLRNSINTIAKQHHITHSTIEVESEDFKCEMNCDR